MFVTFPIVITLAVRVFSVNSPLHHSTRAFYLTSGLFFNNSNSWTAPCETTVKCDPNAKYRSFNGVCSSSDPIRRPKTGSRGQCHRRLVESSFVDSVSEPAEPVNAVELFNAINKDFKPGNRSVDGKFNGLFVFIGQFRAHDMTKTALDSFHDDEGVFDCCAAKNRDLPQCSMAVDVSKAETYAGSGVNCMSFIRAAACPCTEDRARASVNQETAYIDLSHVYIDGSNRDPVRRWRLSETEKSPSGILPSVNPHPSVCYGKRCFSGERRLNQQQGLSLYHVIFQRLHNDMADCLRALRPQLPAEEIFQLARKLNIARWQYIVCNEVMSLQLDDDLMREFRIHIDQLMEGTKPDPKVEAVTFVESVHAAFREHGMVPNRIGGDLPFWINSSIYFERTDYPKQNARSQWNIPSRSFFPFARAVDHMFLRHPSAPIGLSMLLINIQRARDTGVPTFAKLVEWAFGKAIHSFNDLADLGIFRPEDLDLLRKWYNNDVSTMDAYVPLHLTLPHGNGNAGYIIQKIRARQHFGHVYGDRFFFSHERVFSRRQRKAIASSSSISQILCEALGLEQVPAKPLIYNANPTMLNCSDMKPLDLSMMID